VDVNGASVFGVLKATKTRVIWSDGMLYVAKQPDDVSGFACSTAPVRWGGGWKANLDDGKVLQILKPSCSCHRNRELSAMSAADIMASVSVSA